MKEGRVRIIIFHKNHSLIDQTLYLDFDAERQSIQLLFSNVFKPGPDRDGSTGRTGNRPACRSGLMWSAQLFKTRFEPGLPSDPVKPDSAGLLYIIKKKTT